LRTCLTCNNHVGNRFYFCKECSITYHLLNEDGKYKKPTEWEDWIRELYNDEVRRRRLERKTWEKEPLSYDALMEYGIDFYQEDFLIQLIEDGESIYDDYLELRYPINPSFEISSSEHNYNKLTNMFKYSYSTQAGEEPFNEELDIQRVIEEDDL